MKRSLKRITGAISIKQFWGLLSDPSQARCPLKGFNLNQKLNQIHPISEFIILWCGNHKNTKNDFKDEIARMFLSTLAMNDESERIIGGGATAQLVFVINFCLVAN